MAKVYAYFLELTGESGIVTTWTECQEKIKGVKKARYKSFPDRIQAQNWLTRGAVYEKKEAFQKKELQKRELEEGIYFDAGTGRGIGVEVRVSDKFGNSLLEEDCNEFGNRALGFSKTNNYGELTGLSLAIDLAIKKKIFHIYGDSNLVLEFWSQGRFHPEKLEEDTVLLIQEVIRKRKQFEALGGKISYISGDINPADLGFHK
ncbi:hypothetical protein IX329_000105 [Fusobacterium necrophorum]|nr:ribonuclease H family protein [Fusobacterium necrophorum]MBR8732535.1 hypothetical protein [Fusobacterium necrophorum]MBR8788712.1 hypothetical protein [Fusobacterium necrophorum]